jgi:hypothetical protein
VPYPPGSYPVSLPPVYYASPPAAKRNSGPLIGLIIGFVVVLVGGGAAMAIFYVSNSKPSPAVAASTAPFPTTTPQPADTTSASAPPSPETTETATPSVTETRPIRAEPGSPLSHKEFGDWDFGLGSVTFKADKAGGWDYDTCGPVEGKGGVLAKSHCDHAIQVAYSAYGGNLKAVQVLMAFPNVRDAKAAATRLSGLSSDAVKWRRDQAHRSYAYGKVRLGAAKNYVVVTIVTATKAASGKAAKFHGYLQADMQSYFELRDLNLPN